MYVQPDPDFRLHPKASLVVALLALVCALVLAFTVQAQPVPDKLQDLDMVAAGAWRPIQYAGTDSTGWGIYVSSGDTARVYFNNAGEPAVYTAFVGGTLWLRTLTAGTFEVTPVLLEAYTIYRRARDKLGAIEEVDLIRATLEQRYPPIP